MTPVTPEAEASLGDLGRLCLKKGEEALKARAASVGGR